MEKSTIQTHFVRDRGEPHHHWGAIASFVVGPPRFLSRPLEPAPPDDTARLGFFIPAGVPEELGLPKRRAGRGGNPKLLSTNFWFKFKFLLAKTLAAAGDLTLGRGLSVVGLGVSALAGFLMGMRVGLVLLGGVGRKGLLGLSGEWRP
jgi:hypothetical protein